MQNLVWIHQSVWNRALLRCGSVIGLEQVSAIQTHSRLLCGGDGRPQTAMATGFGSAVGFLNLIAGRQQTHSAARESSRLDWRTSRAMRRYLAAVWFVGGEWRSMSIDATFPRGAEVEHGEMKKSRALEGEICNGNRVHVPRNVEMLRKSCFDESKHESITFESDSQLKRIDDSCFSSCFELKSICIPPDAENLGHDGFCVPFLKI
jgi:hypothetical protein